MSLGGTSSSLIDLGMGDRMGVETTGEMRGWAAGACCSRAVFLACSNASSSSFSRRFSFSSLFRSLSCCSFATRLISCCSMRARCFFAFSFACFLNAWNESAVDDGLRAPGPPALFVDGEEARDDHEEAFFRFCSRLFCRCLLLYAICCACEGGIIW
uniref:Uncharacterized protein n=1 Tax=Cacopsylla melanoneura TaxID=428564 RepID=A0A8D8UCX5_9HEMI